MCLGGGRGGRGGGEGRLGVRGRVNVLLFFFEVYVCGKGFFESVYLDGRCDFVFV